MPLGFHRHNNRSKHDLNDIIDSRSVTPSTGDSAEDLGPTRARTPLNPALGQRNTGDLSQPYILQNSTSDLEHRPYQSSDDPPSRSQSTRRPPNQPQSYPSSAAVQSQSQAGTSVDDLILQARRLQQQGRKNTGNLQQPPSPIVEPKEKKGFFGRMRGSKPPPEQKQQSQLGNSSSLSRKASKKEPLRNPAQVERQKEAGYQGGDTRPHLISPPEGVEEDSDLDPYLIRDSEQQRVAGKLSKHSIRAVQDDVQAAKLSGIENKNGELRQHYPQQLQHPPDQAQYHSQDTAQESRYQQPLPNLPPEANIQPGHLVINDHIRQLQNPETISQASYESPTDPREDSRPISVQSNGHSPTGGHLQRDPHDRTTPTQASRSNPQQTMAPTNQGSQQRRSLDAKQALQTQSDTREGQSFQQQQQYRTQPTTPSISPHPSNYRGGPPQREQFGASGAAGEQGRNTPPPGPADQNVADAFKELSQKYKKVKGLYFEKTAQVEQLQNTLANQRLSQSRTSLDDSEYMTRFQRLDGAITNLAFNIRKDWRKVPSWISQSVNQDAVKVGKQEMTAVGRSVISKFLIDEVFDKTFHPALEPEFSSNLKIVERNIRLFSPALNNQEESDALTSKVIQWRLATLEGLRDVLSTPASEEHKKQFTQMATSNLTANLINHLQDPAPAGIQESAHMIMELAVGITANLPLESREISISYPMPGDMLATNIMKVCEGIPSLENPGAESTGDGDSSHSGDKKERAKNAVLQAMMGQSASARKGSVASTAGTDEKSKSTEESNQRVRFAGFVGIEVRGRQILSKAQVWTMA
ncbi:hypothetical protein BP5796_11648 [Coleophoma crateriformis]|uniref:Uncharacterized protein n=1 Tax=Coleophoma crateriformis TaxID=565419 RepID=A0A3D8QDW7_9HELO|nr:hypothetical protein BP5796_11648 [Coleophoma crateriformis]